MPFTVYQDPPRERSEDRAWAIQASWGLLVGVADGAGGTPGGALAADFVERAAHAAAASVADPEDPATWERVLAEMDGGILRAGGGLTTAVLVAVTPGGWRGASVGDSVAWGVLPDGATVDLTAGQRRKPLLGSGEAVPVGFSAERRGRLLVATDGLAKYARAEDIGRAAYADLAAVGPGLVGLVRLPKGTLPDDVAIVVVEGG